MTGTVTISVEIELGWSSHDLGEYGHLSKHGNAEFESLMLLLKTCDKLGVAISFDIVGHLLHSECDGDHDGPHPEGWWDADPGTDRYHDPLFYAPKYIEKIRNAKVDHEICTHTYSHILCEEVSDAVLDHELTTTNDIHAEFKLEKPTSIVTPRHQRASTAVLRDHGIETVRYPLGETWSGSGSFGKIGTLRSSLLAKHPVTKLERSDGIVITRCTPSPSLTSAMLPNGQSSPHPVFRMIPLSIRQRLHYRYLQSAVDQAASIDGHVHLWTHLFNMANPQQMSTIRAGIKNIADYRNNNRVEIRRMCDLPEVLDYE